jgi:hypothetical protein
MNPVCICPILHSRLNPAPAREARGARRHSLGQREESQHEASGIVGDSQDYDAWFFAVTYRARATPDFPFKRNSQI